MGAVLAPNVPEAVPSVIPWTPSFDARQTRLPQTAEALQGLDAWLNGLKVWLPLTQKRNSVPLALKEADIALGMKATPSQVQAAKALIAGTLVEMATGEGKTLAIALAAAHLAKRGRAVHVFTANDYLSRRDAKTMAPLYALLGLRCQSVTSNMDPKERQKNYSADIVYTTAKEALADHLKDQLHLEDRWNAHRRLIDDLRRGSQHINPTLNRGFHHVIIDEADQMLIDEAVTPLILSQKDHDQLLNTLSKEAWLNCFQFEKDRDFFLKDSQVVLTGDGRKILKAVKTGSIGNRSWLEHNIKQALHCREAIHRDEHYVVKDDKIVIVDAETGRLAEGRQWSLGVHRMLELKEGLKGTDPTRPLLSMSFQDFFRRIPHLSGISGTLVEGQKEMWLTYGCRLEKVPLTHPCLRKTQPNRCHPDNMTMHQSIVEESINSHQKGRPVLIGTRTISESEALAKLLKEQGVMPQLLNAVRHEEEADVIRRAGWRAKVTIATNMAGRGSDIPVGEEVLALGGLLLIQVGRNPDPRQDRQLQGRTARQGQPGEVIPHLSLEDSLLERALPLWSHRFICWLPSPLQMMLLPRAYNWAQSIHQKKSRRQRATVLRRAQWQKQHLPTSSLT